MYPPVEKATMANHNDEAVRLSGEMANANKSLRERMVAKPFDGDGDLDLAAGNGSWAGFYLPGVPNRLEVVDGVLILDDYGFWAGQKKAVDEYFVAHGITLLLQRIDANARLAIKTV